MARDWIYRKNITGEIEVFEALAALEVTKAGVMLLPGVGFDVVNERGHANVIEIAYWSSRSSPPRLLRHRTSVSRV
jgi:hypothetical protein